MVTHISYDEAHSIDAASCLAVIRTHIERGWQLIQLRGPQGGPFVAIFRMDDDR